MTMRLHGGSTIPNPQKALTLEERIALGITKVVTVNKHTCQRCEYVWRSELSEPKRCPRCKQYVLAEAKAVS